jgi:hypothetical protein
MFPSFEWSKEDAEVMRWLEAVVTGEEEFTWHLEEPVEWLVDEQCWAVGPGTVEVELEPGTQVVLVNGRGGMQEYAYIVSNIRKASKASEASSKLYLLRFPDSE